MGRPILFALVIGLLVVGVHTVFAEDPQDFKHKAVPGQLKAQGEVPDLSDTTMLESNQGPHLLTDEELDNINGGIIIPPGTTFPPQALLHMPDHAWAIVQNKWPHGLTH